MEKKYSEFKSRWKRKKLFLVESKQIPETQRRDAFRCKKKKKERNHRQKQAQNKIAKIVEVSPESQAWKWKILGAEGGPASLSSTVS